jgi:hypothetical protein
MGMGKGRQGKKRHRKAYVCPKAKPCYGKSKMWRFEELDKDSRWMCQVKKQSPSPGLSATECRVLANMAESEGVKVLRVLCSCPQTLMTSTAPYPLSCPRRAFGRQMVCRKQSGYPVWAPCPATSPSQAGRAPPSPVTLQQQFTQRGTPV